MFFTNLSLVALTLVASVSAAPVGRGAVAKRAVPVVKKDVTPTPTSTTATATATQSGYVTIVSSVNGPAITLAATGSTTVFAHATYTIAPSSPDAADNSTETTDGSDGGDDSAATTDGGDDNAEAPERRWIPRGGKQARSIVKRARNNKHQKNIVTIISSVNGPAVTLATHRAKSTTTTSFGNTVYTIQSGTSTASASDAEPTDAQPTDVQPTDAQPTDAQPTDAQPTDAEPTDAESTDATATSASDATPTDAPTDGGDVTAPTDGGDDTASTDGGDDAAPADGGDNARRTYIPRGGNAARDVIRAAKRKNAAPAAVGYGLVAKTLLTVAAGSVIGSFML